ncbi:TPA: hypothetical protein ACGZ9C_003135 [Elizabethkingia anophelis]
MKRLEEIKNEVAKDFGYESFEHFDDNSTFSYDHKTPKIIDEISKRYAREVAQDSLQKAVPKWNSVKDKMPLAYKTGDWDGKKSDPILVMGEDDKYRVATYYEGYMDGTHFQEFYDDGEYLINKEVTHWLEISDFHTITNNITLL